MSDKDILILSNKTIKSFKDKILKEMLKIDDNQFISIWKDIINEYSEFDNINSKIKAKKIYDVLTNNKLKEIKEGSAKTKGFLESPRKKLGDVKK